MKRTLYRYLNKISYRRRVKHQGCEKPVGNSWCRLVWGHDGRHKPMWGEK